jgi:UrcA family protein
MLVTMIALAATAGIASTAQAGDARTSSARYDSVVVKYSDLDLDSAAGTRALFARLSAAAERACGNAPDARALQRKAQFRACYESALSRAVDKVGSRELQALRTTGAADHVG